MILLLLVILSAEPELVLDPNTDANQCVCAEWKCPKEGPCVCVKVQSCPTHKRAPKDLVEVEE